MIGGWPNRSFGTISYAANETLVLYLPFDEISGGEVLDKSQYGNDATVKGSKLVPVGFGNALESHNSTETVVSDSPSLDFAEAFTIMIWIKAEMNDRVRIFSEDIHPTSGWAVVSFFNLANPPTGVHQLEFFNNGTRYGIRTRASIFDGKWHHMPHMYEKSIPP